MVERIKNYLVYIFSNFSKSTHQMYAKKLHTLRLWQKNCTPSGFYGKKIAPFWAASLSEIAIWCATWTGMQNNCSIIKLYYRVLIIPISPHIPIPTTKYNYTSNLMTEVGMPTGHHSSMFWGICGAKIWKYVVLGNHFSLLFAN